MAPPPEIAIPSTSVSDEGSSKPFTLYNITLRLPLRSYVVQKRYSEFVRLHGSLVEQVGSPPPEPLPAKHWLKSTVRSADLARQRQLGLEKYLRSIAESPDRRWRDTSVWRAFLNLPSTSSTSNSTASAAGRVGNAAAGAADPGTWLDIHKELKQSLLEARQCLSRRDGCADGGQGTAAVEAGAAAKRALVRAASLVAHLSDGLRMMHEANRLGEGELRRRRDLVSTARMERDALEKLSNSMPSGSGSGSGGGGPASAAEKSHLLRGGRPAGRVLGAPLPETDKTRELDNQGVLVLQKQEMEAQDEQVDQLAAIIRRQKDMGLRIHDEVEAQSEMLERMDQDASRVMGKVQVANNRIKKM
ncbi:Vacuolar morphogenesis protein 7 like protein [Ophiocordyceps camponoti-floridani]|uniref:Vacuolar morphogenesis protein 7 like protein n=1 Tax=Ophiocordyceps camponoti-floridani TaxID=2030778 RepID=A0A8H4Q0W7_9HYPO|nr:Vacuolar morphogenesis protein 7 like protein [Ophiocordyceps camponoti-floridani]